MKTSLFLSLSLILAACGGTDAPAANSSNGANSSAAKEWSTKSDAPAETPADLQAADLPPVENTPLAPRIEPQYKPAQEPTYHFEGEAITDSELKDFYLEMDIQIDDEDVGTMTFVLWGDQAPITVRNFLRYADEGYYNGRVFHRILRDFMVQGGSSNNSASGQGPHPMIKGEFSKEDSRRHRYGVLSMARSQSPDSASSQFFIITDSNSPSVHGLDGKYASFGILYHGVDVLERLADVPTVPNPMTGEPSQPTQRAIIKELRVLRGTPTVEAEEIERPPVDLHGEPERIRIQHVLISFAGTRTTATRSKEEAETLAKDIFERAKKGEDFASMVMEYSDDPGGKMSNPPGSYSLLNKGQYPPELSPEQDQERQNLEKELMALQDSLKAEIGAGTKTLDDARKEFMASPAMQKIQTYSWTPREKMVPAFSQIGFGLKVGEVGLAEYDPQNSPFGWHIILRYE